MANRSMEPLAQASSSSSIPRPSPPPLPPAAASEMETGIVLAFGGNCFKKTLPRQIHLRTGLHRQDWEAVVADLNHAVDREIGLWAYVCTVVLLPMCVHTGLALTAASYLGLSDSILSVIMIAVFFPASCSVVSLVQMPARVARAVAAAQDALAEINERYRSVGFDFSLMERKEYSRRYLMRPKASQLRPGHMLVVRRLASHDCGMGGPFSKEFASEVPGEWTTDPRPRAPAGRRKMNVTKRRGLAGKPAFHQRAPRRTSGPTVV